MQFYTDRELFYTDRIWSWASWSAINGMQFTDRELYYTKRIWSSRSVQTVRSVTKISPAHNEASSQREWNIPSPTNEMQFTDRELFYTDRIWNSRSVKRYLPLTTRMKYSKCH